MRRLRLRCDKDHDSTVVVPSPFILGAAGVSCRHPKGGGWWVILSGRGAHLGGDMEVAARHGRAEGDGPVP